MIRRLPSILGLLCVSVAPALAYEINTHAYISVRAFERSNLGDADRVELYQRLGFDRFDEAYPFKYSGLPTANTPDTYADETAAQVFFRPVQAYETFAMPLSYQTPGFSLGTQPWLRFEGWLMRGAVREDDLEQGFYTDGSRPDPDPYGEITRVYSHFYDPIHDSELEPYGASCGVVGVAPCNPSLAWAMGTTNPLDPTPSPDASRRNHFSVIDATNAYYRALIYRPETGIAAPLALFRSEQRLAYWATTLKALGNVMHLLQDSAQPQHVRNDAHNHSCEFPFTIANRSIPGRTMEPFTNYRVTGAADEAVDCGATKWIDIFSNDPEAASPVPSGSYPIPQFPRARQYLTTRTPAGSDDVATRRGLADYTNRGFFSEGTLDGVVGPFASPPPIGDPSYFVGPSDTAIVPGLGTVEVNRLFWQVPDAVVTYADVGLDGSGRAPIASVSLWYEIAQQYGVVSQVPFGAVLSLKDFRQHADMLVPRAISYSAGLIDFFFRGRLEVQAPLDGLFSVIDHATPHTVDAEGYPRRTDNNGMFGFTKVRLVVRNATPVINESGANPPATWPQSVVSTSATPGPSDATLVAVARFHRNPCYRPNLSGDRRVQFDGVVVEPTGCPALGTRTPYQEIAVSKPAAATAADLNGSGAAIAFDFSLDPIPVNATDLLVQVVYRGTLGQEQDSVAVGTLDVREPTYVTLWNNTDYAGCSGSWFYFTGIPPGCILEGSGAQRGIQTTRICIGTQLIFEHLQNPHGDIFVFGYVRLATLLDGATKGTRSRNVVVNIKLTEIRNRSITGQVRQSAKEEPTAAAPFNSEPLWTKRGYIGSFRPLPYYQINGADPQPASDAGPLDVGALTQPATVPPAPDPGNILFPDVAASNMACTIASAQPMFPDEAAR